MSATAIKAGKAFYEIFAKDKTAKGLSSAEQALMKFGAKIGIIGTAISGFAAAGLTGVTAMVKGFAGAGDDLADAMSMTGLSGDFLQTLKFAAADAGLPMEGLIGAVGRMGKVLTAAASGSKSAQAALAKLGLSAEQLAGMTQDERFRAIADGISKIDDPAQRSAAAMAIFGKAGQKLLPIFEGGAKGLREMQAEMKNRGLIMSPEDIALAGKANGAFLMLSATFKHIRDLVGAAVAPVFLKVAGVLQSVAEAVARFVNNNRQLISGLAIGLGVLGAVGVALMAIGGASTGLAAAFSGIGAVIGAILSPVGLVIAAIVACGAAAVVAGYYLDKLFNGGRALQFLKDAAMGAWEALKLLWQAASAGRWDLAGKLIKDGLTVGFYGAILSIKEAWHAMLDWMTKKLTDKFKEMEKLVPAWATDLFAWTKGPSDSRDEKEDPLAEDRARLTAASADLAATIAEIKKAGAANSVVNRYPDLTRKMAVVPEADSMFSTATAGTFNSAGAALLGRAAPANTVEEKQVDLLAKILGAVEGVDDSVQELEGLTVD